MNRCPWAADELMIHYHDKEWGTPIHDDKLLFEFLVLEGAQAGLSWSTILKKRPAYRIAFDHFNPASVASYGDKEIDQLINNPGIIRNRRKIDSAINNAKVFLSIKKEFGSFDQYIWGFVGNKPINHRFTTLQEIPAETELSRTISQDLKAKGMKFVGPTIMYAFMQAVGLVNDHLVGCFRYNEIINASKDKL